MKRPIALGTSALLLSLAGAASSSALTMTPNPLPFEIAGASLGELRLLEVVDGLPAGGVVQFGALTPASITLVIQFLAGPLAPAAIELFPFSNIAAVGHIPGDDLDIQLGVLSATSGAGFALDNSSVTELDQAFDRFFVSYSTISPGDVMEFRAINLLVFQATIVPEPGTSTMLSLAGLAAIGLSTRRRMSL